MVAHFPSPHHCTPIVSLSQKLGSPTHSHLSSNWMRVSECRKEAPRCLFRKEDSAESIGLGLILVSVCLSEGAGHNITIVKRERSDNNNSHHRPWLRPDKETVKKKPFPKQRSSQPRIHAFPLSPPLTKGVLWITAILKLTSKWFSTSWLILFAPLTPPTLPVTYKGRSYWFDSNFSQEINCCLLLLRVPERLCEKTRHAGLSLIQLLKSRKATSCGS